MNQFDIISTLIARWEIAFDVHDYMHINRKHSSTQKYIMANMHQLLYHQNSIEQFMSCELPWK